MPRDILGAISGRDSVDKQNQFINRTVPTSDLFRKNFGYFFGKDLP